MKIENKHSYFLFFWKSRNSPYQPLVDQILRQDFWVEDHHRFNIMISESKIIIVLIYDHRFNIMILLILIERLIIRFE